MTVSHFDMVESVTGHFAERFGGETDVSVVMAPGRVNLIGEYTDFNDGFVFPMTIDRGVYVAIRERSDKIVRVASVRFDEQIEYDLQSIVATKPGTWSSYVLGVVEELRLRGHLKRGFEAVIDGNLDLGAGLSSSAALEVATAAALQHVMDFEMDPVEMVQLCQHVEHNYANVLCGIMDQFACLIGKRDHALLLDCRSLDFDLVPVVLGDYQIVIISSGVKRSLASSAYNARRAECQEAVEFFRRLDGSVKSLRDTTSEMLRSHGDQLSPTIRRRCRHVISENQRVLDAAKALRSGRLRDFGETMTHSHNSLRDDFEVSCSELDLLVKLAVETDGVLGSRMTGAGFGGCTVSLVHEDALSQYVDKLGDYTKRFGITPNVFALERNFEAGPVV